MAQVKHDNRIVNRTQRAKLSPRREPYWLVLEEGRALGYRRGTNGGTWIARIYLPDHPKKQLYKSLGPADDHADPDGVVVLSFAQAQARAREWFGVALTLATGEEVHTGPYTLADALADYLKDCERRGLRQVDRMECAARLHILPELGEVEVSKLTQARIEKWHLTLAKSTPKVRQSTRPKPVTKKAKKVEQAPPVPLSGDAERARKASSNRVLTILKAALNHAKRRGRALATGDAWREAKPFRGVDRARDRFLNTLEVQRLVNACPEDFRRLVRGALFTGARYGELGTLLVKDFNPEGAGGKGTIFILRGKGRDGGKSRHIVLAAEGRAFFESLTAGRPTDEPMFLRVAYASRNWRGEKVARAWTKSEQFRFMNAACKKAKLEPMTFHELRHTYASFLVNAGVPLAYVAAQLGHADTRMVEKHYGHLAPSALADAITKLAPELGIFEPDGVAPLKVAPKMA